MVILNKLVVVVVLKRELWVGRKKGRKIGREGKIVILLSTSTSTQIPNYKTSAPPRPPTPQKKTRKQTIRWGVGGGVGKNYKMFADPGFQILIKSLRTKPFYNFSFSLLLKITSFLLYVTLRGTMLVYLGVPLSSPSDIQFDLI